MSDEFTVNEGDQVRSLKSRNGVPQNDWTAEQFRDFTARMNEYFPECIWEVGTEMADRKTTGDDFFIGFRREPSDQRPRVFVVKKGQGVNVRRDSSH